MKRTTKGLGAWLKLPFVWHASMHNALGLTISTTKKEEENTGI
jgi:hypothetical protein